MKPNKATTRARLLDCEKQLLALEPVASHNPALLRDYIAQQRRRRQLTADLLAAYEAQLAALRMQLAQAQADCPGCGLPLVVGDVR